MESAGQITNVIVVQGGSLGLDILKILAPLAGSFITAMLIIRANHSLADKQRVRKAKDEFKRAFVVEIAELEQRTSRASLGRDEITVPLKAALDRQKQAVVEIGSFLNEDEKAKLKKAWEDYCYLPPIRGEGPTNLEQYARHFGSGDDKSAMYRAIEARDKLKAIRDSVG